MTEAETSIEQLTDNRDSTNNGTIIDEILQEINKSVPEGEAPPTLPPPNISFNEETPIQEQILQPQPQQQQQQQQQIIQQQLMPQQQQQNFQEQEYSKDEPVELKSAIDSTTDTLGYLKDNILDELKLPSVVLILFVILSSSRIDGLFIKTHSNFFIDSSGNLTFPSIFIKAILAALIFYIFKLFI